jgi:hypothetical protein
MHRLLQCSLTHSLSSKQLSQVFWQFAIFVISVFNWLLKSQVKIGMEYRRPGSFSKPFPNRYETYIIELFAD